MQKAALESWPQKIGLFLHYRFHKLFRKAAKAIKSVIRIVKIKIAQVWDKTKTSAKISNWKSINSLDKSTRFELCDRRQ